MRLTLIASAVLAVSICGAVAHAQQPSAAAPQRPRPQPVGPVQSDRFHTTYVRLGNNDEGLLYEPVSPGANARVALLYSHPAGNNFNVLVAPEMANRGYRLLVVNHHGDEDGPAVFAGGVSRGIGYLRALPGVQRVVISGHSGGGHTIAFYADVAEHGPAACQGPEKLYKCTSEEVTGLAKPDGVILLDPTLGAFHSMSAVDPAVEGPTRKAALDLFASANGYDSASRQASYAPEFARRFHAAQAARNASLIDAALARLKLIEQGKGQFSDDEPLVIPGMSSGGTGARLYHADLRLLSRTRKPHVLLKADGTQPEIIVTSVRPSTGGQAAEGIGKLETTQNTTVRRFLANSALRTSPDYALTPDNIVGVDWKSAQDSTPGSAEGITVPVLVLSMSCHYLVVPGEIVFEHLASKDKSIAYVEGAVHNFTPCRPEYGDTVKRGFDYVDGWLRKEGRF
jgi:hypothetical protein